MGLAEGAAKAYGHYLGHRQRGAGGAAGGLWDLPGGADRSGGCGAGAGNGHGAGALGCGGSIAGESGAGFGVAGYLRCGGDCTHRIGAPSGGQTSGH